jgi:hypothetical protein
MEKDTAFLPMSRGAGKPGLLIAKEPLFPPISRGAGRPGLPADTIALAKQGTVSAADKIRTENDFTKRASPGSKYSWRIAYAVRTLVEVAWHRYNFGGI